MIPLWVRVLSAFISAVMTFNLFISLRRMVSPTPFGKVSKALHPTLFWLTFALRLMVTLALFALTVGLIPPVR